MASEHGDVWGGGLGRHLLNEQAQANVAAEYQPTPGELRERRRYEIQQYIATLRDAAGIRCNEALMTEIRAYIRQECRELGALLDI